jgi:hypothetical protein
MKTARILKRIEQVFNLWAIHFLVYNLWFGFNDQPINEAEELQDFISKWVLSFIIIIYGVLIMRVLRHYIKNNMRD